MGNFLKAEWRNLAMANYEIDPGLLTDMLPAKTELDTWTGRCYVSLVGFMFINTRVLGVKVPFHVNFEEVNLRFYVRHHDGAEWKRGVVFIKEIVPKPALTFIANTVYHEQYETLPMGHFWQHAGKELTVEYSWKKSAWQRFQVIASMAPQDIPAGSEEEFITEHYWGYTKVNSARTLEYQVTHPRWQVHPVREHKIEVDFGKVYGKSFAFLSGQKPVSVFLAQGSEIAVNRARTLR